MNKFKEKLNSKKRTGELKLIILKSIYDYSNNETDLTEYEVNSVLLEILADENNKNLKEQFE